MCSFIPLDKIPTRLVLYFMSLSGFMISYMLRTDMNVTIVAMLKRTESEEVLNSTCNNAQTYYQNETLIHYNDTLKLDEIEIDLDERLDWSNKVKSYVLASFYWAYLLSQILGAVLTSRYGAKLVYGTGQFLTAICTFMIPAACERHYTIVIFLRSLQGFFSGVTWPAMFSLMTTWVPVMERTTFMSVVQGKNLGVGLTYPLCGYIVTYLGWKSVFYSTGTIGIIWSGLWYLLVFNSPDSHPRISNDERRYIKEHRANVEDSRKNQDAPWINILTSLPVWCIISSAFGWYWVNFMFIIGGPTYLSHVQGFNIRESGILAGTPYLISMPITFTFCYFADKIITRKLLSVTNTRKSFTFLGQVVPGILLITIGYLGCNTQAVLVVWFVAITMPTAMFAGTMTNMTDIAPAFAGYVVAFSQTIYLLASFISPLATGYFTRNGNTVTAWQTVFNVSAGFTIISFTIYAIWGTADVQPWNSKSTFIQEEENMLHVATPVAISNSKLNRNEQKRNLDVY